MAFSFSRTLPLEVRLAGAGDNEQHDGCVYGTIPGRNLIVGGFASTEFSVGDELVVKSNVGSHIIGFWSTVERCLGGEEKLYLLSYPKQIEELDLRKSERLNVIVPVEMHLATGSAMEANFEGLLLNISDGGCLLSSERDWSQDLQCELKFALPGTTDAFVLSGRVIRMK